MQSPLARQYGRATHTAVDELADDAADWVLQTLDAPPYRSHSSIEPLARQLTRTQILDLVAFLAGAMASGERSLFYDYVGWLAEVLASRALPVQSLHTVLGLLRSFFAARLPPDESRCVDSMLQHAIDEVAEPAIAHPRYDRAQVDAESSPELGQLTAALIAGEQERAREITERGLDGAEGYPRLVTHLVQPAMYQVGLLWQENRISVAQEHQATAIMAQLLTDLHQGCRFDPPNGRTALLAGVEGNQHSLGQQSIGDVLELRGWRVVNLGPDSDAEALLARASGEPADVIGLSISLVEQIPEALQLIERLRADLGGHRPPVLVGGRATNQFVGLWGRLGADGWFANAEQAYREAS